MINSKFKKIRKFTIFYIFYYFVLISVYPSSIAKNSITKSQLKNLPNKRGLNNSLIIFKNKSTKKILFDESFVSTDILAWNPFEKYTNPLGVLRKNEYNRCVNRLSNYRNIPPPLRIKSSKSSYCSCVVKEVTFFKRLRHVVYNEAWHCTKLIEDEVWRNLIRN